MQLHAPRLPYHPAIEERFGIDKSGWKALVEAVFPSAQSADSVILALGYCKARGLDPFKKCVHIVPIYDKKKGRYVDTVWPGIGELRTTAFRTKGYAGRDMTLFGPTMTDVWTAEQGRCVEVEFPEWAQVTVYRIVQGQRVAFAGPPVYWLEAFASGKGGVPNSMWTKRPRGQIDKCAEAAALRAAFPEEIGDDFTSDDGPMIYQHGQTAIPQKVEVPAGNEGLKAHLAKTVDNEALGEAIETTQPQCPEDLLLESLRMPIGPSKECVEGAKKDIEELLNEPNEILADALRESRPTDLPGPEPKPEPELAKEPEPVYTCPTCKMDTVHIELTF